MHTAAQLSEPLLRAGVLFAPARILPSTVERLHERNHEDASPSNSMKARTLSTPRKRSPALPSQSGQPWNNSCDLLRRLNCPGRPRPPDPQISSSRSRASVDLTSTEVTLRDALGRLAPHGVQTRDVRMTSRP
jgi:hypothetical protein